MKKATFEWDEAKNKENQSKHGVSFSIAQQAFLDPRRVIAEDILPIVMKKIGIIVWGVSVKVS
jgi:uncharacterized DUF497 family protein